MSLFRSTLFMQAEGWW